MKEQISITQPLIALVFQATNVPDSAGNAKTVEPSSNEYVMPWAGSIVGMSVRHNADLTGGVITWRPTIDGTANTVMTSTTDDTNQGDYDKTNTGKVPFAAGARLGVDWTKTGTVAPTTTDATIVLFVELDEVRV